MARFKKIFFPLLAVKALIIFAFVSVNPFKGIKPVEVVVKAEENSLTDSTAFNSPDKDDRSQLPKTLELSDSAVSYFVQVTPELSCFREGTDLKMMQTLANHNLSRAECSCIPGYFGRDCGIPEVVWSSCKSGACRHLVQRSVPRRLIHGVNINHELEFFEARLNEIGDVTDALIVAESYFTSGGDPSQTFLLPKLKEGFMSEHQHKIIHVLIDYFPPEGLVDGWLAEMFIRAYMGQEGLKRIKGIRDDDLFLLLDADEIPDKRVLLFLKLYDGYPQPIALTLRWSVYGFFWKRKSGEKEETTKIVAACTIGMIHQVYAGNVYTLRTNHLYEEPLSSRVKNYVSSGNKFNIWNIGEVGHYAGHHCSWCYRPDGIRLKLMSAQKDDKPRWGDYPEKLDLNYISGLIKSGQWFDGSKPFFLVLPEEDSYYAPEFFLRNKKRFDYILSAPAA